MLFDKAHLEFHRLDVENGWETPARRPPGVPRGRFKSEGGCVPFAIHDYDEGTV